MKKIGIEILVSTKDRENLDFLNNMFPDGLPSDLDVLIVHQSESGNALKSDIKQVRIFNMKGYGLSRSRNKALELAKGDVCLFADDDIEYEPDFIHKVIQVFGANRDIDVACFQIRTPSGKPYKNYPDQSRVMIRNRDLRAVSSVEIAFRRQSVQSLGVRFDERFGLGSDFPSGEEYLFLKALRDKGLSLWFQKDYLVIHPLRRSTSDPVSREAIRAHAAIYYSDYGRWAFMYLLKYLFYFYRSGHLQFSQIRKTFAIGMKAITDYKSLERGTKI